VGVFQLGRGAGVCLEVNGGAVQRGKDVVHHAALAGVSEKNKTLLLSNWFANKPTTKCDFEMLKLMKKYCSNSKADSAICPL
jgi:hypothetical protein